MIARNKRTKALKNMPNSMPAYVSSGAGPDAVICLHGIGGRRDVWQPQMQTIVRCGFRAVAWDAPGYGDTPQIEAPGWDGFSAALLRLIDGLELERCVLLGHSFGGMMAQHFASKHGPRVKALVLSATSPAFGKSGGDWQRDFIARRVGPLDEGRTMEDLSETIVASLVGDNPDPAGVTRAKKAMAACPDATYRRSIEVLVTFDMREHLSRIAVPTLVIAGEKDTNAPSPMMERMAARIPGARFVLVPGAGHLANLEQPLAFNAALSEFLQSIRVTGRERACPGGLAPL